MGLSFPKELAKMSSLTSLSLFLTYPDMEVFLEAMESHPFSELWPNMQKLCLSPINPFTEKYPNATMFPESLTHFESTSSSYDLGLLPRQIKKFAFVPFNPHRPVIFFSLANPPPLTSLSIVIPIHWKGSFRHLPKTLTELEITVRTEELLQQLPLELPPLLSSLHICTNAAVLNNSLLTVSFRKLDQLRRLKLVSDSMPGAPHATGTLQHPFPQRLFPLGLEELVLKLDIHNSEITLPPRLKVLDLSACFINLPLILYHLSNEHPHPRYPGIPSSLEVLKTPHFEQPNCLGKTEAICDLISSPDVLLDSVSLRPLHLSDSVLSIIPSPIAGMTSLTPPNWWPSKRRISLLQDPAFATLTTLHISNADSFGKYEFKFLPRSLTSLIMTFESLKNPLVESIYADLPLRLRTLAFNGWNNAHPLGLAGFQALSKLSELETLNTGFSLLELRDESVALLPRSLRRLSLFGPTTLSGACFAYLPRFLRELSIPAKIRIKDDHYRLLPRSIHTCNLYGCHTPNLDSIMPPSALGTICLHDSKDSLSLVPLKAPQPDTGALIDPRTPFNSFLTHNNPVPPPSGEDDWIYEGEEAGADNQRSGWPLVFLSRLWSKWWVR
jgi:hypothetical protein